jgi:hypothetical protein
VVLDFWERHAADEGDMFTTIGNWRQSRDVTFDGDWRDLI